MIAASPDFSNQVTEAADTPHLCGNDIQSKMTPLYGAVGHLIRRLDQRINATFDRMMIGMPLTRTQFVLLIVVTLAPRLEQAEVAALASLDAATAGVVLRRLERMGLVSRARSPRSRRGFLVDATAAGRETIQTHFPKLNSVQADILSPLTEKERQAFLELLAKLVGLPLSQSSGQPSEATSTFHAR